MRRPRASLAAGVLLAAGALLGGCGGAPTGGGARTAAELTNPRLSPERASWLVGAISRMATREEVEAYLAATDDAAAAALEEAFWERRDPDPARPGNPPRELFDRRSVDADRRFTEAGYRGRRSDRGTIFVLYGEPAEISFEINPHVGQTPIEVWTYAHDAGAGLAGRPPAESYRFIKDGDLTVLYRRPVVEEDRVVRDLP